MEYRGKHYTVVQGIGPDAWKWTVYQDDNTVKSGLAATRKSAETSAIWAIDKALTKKPKPTPPKKFKLRHYRMQGLQLGDTGDAFPRLRAFA